MPKFAITGVAGYIAPRHLKAVKETQSTLVAAMDPHDSVGILDSFFPEAAYFREFERFDRHLDKLRRSNPSEAIDWMAICSPNHLHDAHVRLALRLGAGALCEKPLVLNPWNLDALADLEREYGGQVKTVLQLRVHPKLVELRRKLQEDKGRRHQVRLTYITSRGAWYKYSWKGHSALSGGIATNIGIHFFDLLLWLFGDPVRSDLHFSEEDRMGGTLELANADVSWFLSIAAEDLPESVKGKARTFRSILLDGSEIEFTEGFTDLHTRVYEETIAGRGFGIDDARASIELVHDIRSAKPSHPSVDPREMLAEVVSA